MADPSSPTLVRAIGRWSLVALGINCIIGSGVFGLPSVIVRLVGNASPLPWLFAAVATAVVMACFAEVASRFDRTGGIYLYTRTAFGRTAGISVAWLGWLTRLASTAANANLFVIYLAEFWPSVKLPVARALILTLLLGLLAAVNYIGVQRGNVQNNLFTVAKLLTLGIFILAGLLFMTVHHRPSPISLPAVDVHVWLRAVLLLIFAYGGFETALTVGGEARDPRRDYPFMLFSSLIVCTLVYTLSQWVVVSVVPLSAMTDRPLADAVRVMIGSGGARLVSVGVLVATYGYLSANLLAFPRMLFAQAERGELPPLLAIVHPKFRTPHASIFAFAACLWVFSLVGGFEWNVTVSAIGRLIYYALVAAALPVLRRKPDVREARFRLPFGYAFSTLGIAISLLLFPRVDRAAAFVLLALAACIAANVWWANAKETRVRS
jgi:amino acid transporter